MEKVGQRLEGWIDTTNEQTHVRTEIPINLSVNVLITKIKSK